MSSTRRGMVIDASVARAAGESEHPVSSRCRSFLVEVRQICYRLAATDAILEEWNRNRSRFSGAWLVSMYARKKVDRFEIETDTELRAAIPSAARSQEDRDNMLKDVHLIEAALHRESPVVSLDETARGLFRTAAGRVGRLKQVVWVNPAKPADKALQWLKEGAQSDLKLTLGAETEE